MEERLVVQHPLAVFSTSVSTHISLDLLHTQHHIYCVQVDNNPISNPVTLNISGSGYATPPKFKAVGIALAVDTLCSKCLGSYVKN